MRAVIGHRPKSWAAALAALAFAVSACGRTPPRAVQLPLNPPWWQPAVPLAHSALSAVLAGGSPLPGQDLDERRLSYLREYLAVLAGGGPESTPELFPDPAHVIAYYLNAHVAWAHALASAPALRGRTVDALLAQPIGVDRRVTTLAALAARARAEAAGEPRVELLLNPGWRGGPPLPPAAMEGYSLAWQLSEHARRCGHAPGFWGLERDTREIRISSLVRDMQGLPDDPRQRVRRTLDLVPPPPSLRSSILATCGDQLQRCSVRFVPVDRSRA